MDGSFDGLDGKTPASYDYNVGMWTVVRLNSLTLWVCQWKESWAFLKVSLERSESGRRRTRCWRGRHFDNGSNATDPQEAVDFVNATGIRMRWQLAIGYQPRCVQVLRAHPTARTFFDIESYREDR